MQKYRNITGVGQVHNPPPAPRSFLQIFFNIYSHLHSRI